MAEQRYLNLTTFKGINRALSKRLDPNYFNAMSNLDSNIIEGALVSRKGSTVKQSSGSTPNIDKFVMFRDEEWGKDVLLVYDKDSTAANRKIYVYTRTINTDDSFAPHTTASYSYGSLRFGDQVTFLVHRNTVRIGTGTAVTNKAMFCGYINRAVGSNHGAMFNDQIAFADLFLLKQQWVQQADCFSSSFSKVRYDSTREKFYILTSRGLEIRDSDFYTEKILSDVVAWTPLATSSYQGGGAEMFFIGGVEIISNTLYVLGMVPDLDGSNNLVTKIVQYDINNGYELSATAISKTTSDISSPITTGDRLFGMTTDGTNIFVVWSDGTDSFLSIYSSALALVADKVYTNAGVTTAWDCTRVGDYIYLIDDANDNVIQVLKSAPYTSATYNPTITAGYLTAIETDGTDLILTDVSANQTDIYTIAINATFANSTLENTETFAGRRLPGSSCIGATPYIHDVDRGQLYKYDNTTNWNITNIYPGKISIQTWPGRFVPNNVTDQDSLFYAVSIIDIYGQESHLMRGCHMNRDQATNINIGHIVRITVDAASETYASEFTSPTTDPDDVNSIWNEFRRIKKIRVWRAHNTEGFSKGEPTTSYNFLREIDINDTLWVEDVSDQTYTYTFVDDVPTADISSVTYEESSGLPETFKPYYTNWQYGTQFESRYYYGNLRTDEANAHQIIQTLIDAPDVVYQHDENIDYFYTKDGDEIKGFATVWNRMVIFKGDNVAIYNELTKENVYSIGLSAPNSILVHNNVVYFVYGTGIWALTPSGYERISEPVDEILATESSLTGMSGVYFKEKQKLWWLVPQSNSYCFNINTQTWDMYDIQTGNRDVIYIGQGLSDTIYTADQYDDKIYKENSGDTDAGTNMTVSFTSNDIPVGGEYVNSTFTRLHLTASSSGDTVPITVLWRNENGSNSVTKTFSLSGGGDLATRKMFLSGAYGQHVRFMLSKAITKQLQIHSVGVEYYQQGKINNAN